MVYCKFCHEKAIIRIPYAKLTLCSKHFNEYLLRKVLKSIERYHMLKQGDKVLLAVSGGKDSATLLHVLSSIRHVLGIELYGIHINLGLGEYSRKSQEIAEKLFNLTKTSYVIVDLEKGLGYTIKELSKLGRRTICSVCGLVKRYTLNAIAKHFKINCIATGHTLDDMIAYIVKEFIMGNYDQLARIKPRLEEIPNLMPSRIKPLTEVSERESLVYVLANKLPIYHEECPFSPEESLERKIKQFFNSLEVKHPGIKIQFLRKIVKNNFLTTHRQDEVKKCSICGMPTSANTCAFCKLIFKIEGEYDRINKFLEYINSLTFKN